MKLALIIQGPLNQHSLDAIPYYQTLGDVFLSHYQDYVHPTLPIDQVVRNNPDVPPNAWNGQNVYLQCLSTLAGLQAAIRKGGYDIAIKLRSDQSFGDLTKFIYAVNSAPDKYTCSNLHFRPDRICKFHASDKLVGAGIYQLRDCFQLALRRCVAMREFLMSGIYEVPPVHATTRPYMYPAVEQDGHTHVTYEHSFNPPFEQSPDQPPVLGYPRKLAHDYDGVYPEVLIATSWLMSKGIVPNRYYSKHQMQSNFQIVRVEELGKYVNKYGSSHVEHNWQEIDNISEI